VDFEHFIIPDKLSDYLINSIVKLNVFFLLIMFYFEDRIWLLWCFSEVFFHVEKKFEQQF